MAVTVVVRNLIGSRANWQHSPNRRVDGELEAARVFIGKG
jgi:hypothetical protein